MRISFNLWIFVFLLSFYSVLAMPTCDDNIQPLTECQVITPTITNNLTYTIYLNNGSIFDSGNLTNYVEDIYYFNFSGDTNDYFIILGDGTTRSLFVNYYNLNVFGESFNWLAIICISIAISGICLWISKLIKNPDLELFKVALFFYGLLNTFIMVILILFITSGSGIVNFNAYFNIYVTFALLILMLFILYYIIFIVIQTFKNLDKLRKIK